jgi:signal transduction histidine kinase
MQEGLLAIIILAALLLGLAIGLWWSARRTAPPLRRASAPTSADDRRNPAQDAAQALALQRMIGGLAHDLNSSLSVVVMNLDVMQQDERLGEKYGRRTDNMMKAMQKASQLTRFLLNFAHRHKPQTEVVSIAELLPSLVDLLRAALGKQVEVSALCAEDLWNTEIDVAAFETAVIHLAAALAGAADMTGRLTIEARNGRAASGEPSEHVILAMVTSGISAVNDTAPRSSEALLEPGSGVDVVEAFAARCGGSLRIAAEAPPGLRASLYLPRCRETAEV